jgi:hypothetical protein
MAARSGTGLPRNGGATKQDTLDESAVPHELPPP